MRRQAGVASAMAGAIAVGVGSVWSRAWSPSWRLPPRILVDRVARCLGPMNHRPAAVLGRDHNMGRLTETANDDLAHRSVGHTEPRPTSATAESLANASRAVAGGVVDHRTIVA